MLGRPNRPPVSLPEVIVPVVVISRPASAGRTARPPLSSVLTGSNALQKARAAPSRGWFGLVADANASADRGFMLPASPESLSTRAAFGPVASYVSLERRVNDVTTMAQVSRPRIASSEI